MQATAKLDGGLNSTLTYNDFLDAMLDNVGFLFDESWINAMRYNGFDPEETFRTILKAGNTLGKTKKEFFSDIIKMLIFFVLGGNNFDRSNKKWANEQDGVATKKLMADYGVVKNLKNGNSPQVITLARLGIVFNEVIAAMYEVGIAKPIVTDEALPYCFTFPAAPSLMTDTEWKTHKVTWGKVQTKFARTVSRYKKSGEAGYIAPSTTDDELAEIALGYAETGRSSDFSIRTRAAKRNSFTLLVPELLKIADKMGKGRRTATKPTFVPVLTP